MTKDLDKIANEAYQAILKWHAQSIWHFEIPLWIPDEYLPMTPKELSDVSAKIFKLIEKGE